MTEQDQQFPAQQQQPPPPQAPPERQSRRGGKILLAVALVAVLFSAWWYTEQGPGAYAVVPNGVVGVTEVDYSFEQRRATYEQHRDVYMSSNSFLGFQEYMTTYCLSMPM